MLITLNKLIMKLNTILLSILFVLCSYLLNAQSSLASYAGNWKMTPVNATHKFSKMNISDNGMTLTMTFKKSSAKSATARYNPATNRVEPFIDNKGYYLVLGAQPNTMSMFELETNTKVGDFIK
jgi:hypothetical protein